MRTKHIYLALAMCLLCYISSAQWVRTMYPLVAGHWVGTCSATYSGIPGVYVSAMDAEFTQAGSSLAGSWVYTFTNQGATMGFQTRSKFTGTITESGQIALAETSWIALNWSGQNWGLNSYRGMLSAGGDSIYGKGTTDTVSMSQTLVLVKMMTSVDPARGELPNQFFLQQNYPNPFNPSTTIRYGLPHKSQVSLTVYNTLGQIVSRLVSGEQEAGYHEVRFDASGLSSGVYFYRLSAGTYVETRKLLLIR
jgi:hypothetical protein